LRLAEKELCTDNAAMIGILAERKLAHRGFETGLGAEIMPNWSLENPAAT
jgi:tRNA A37 threonylcarbamoyltransferase TsaD